MSIVSIVQMWSRDSSMATISDDRTIRGYSASTAFQIVTSADATREEVLAAAGLPRVGDVLAGAPAIFVKKVNPIRVSPILWIATVDYGGEFGPAGVTESPLNNPPEINWTDAETDEPIDTDADGNAIVTANGEPIYGVTAKFADPVLNVTRNFRTINLYGIAAYRRSVNSDSFQGWPPGTARLIRYAATKVYDNAGGYWKVSAAIRFRAPIHTTAEQAWFARVRHEGLYEKDANGNIVRAVDRLGEFVQRPVLLKSDGTRENDINSAYWKLFRRYAPLPYSALGLL